MVPAFSVAFGKTLFATGHLSLDLTLLPPHAIGDCFSRLAATRALRPYRNMPSPAISFEQILDAATEFLQRKQRLTYEALKRQFDLDDKLLEDLKQELIRGQRVARDEDGLLVWQGHDRTASERRLEGERRQITIVFCDLADSTALSNSLDPEEMRVVLRAFEDAVDTVVARHEGFVNNYMGDGIVIFFGYPQAHEDDAERAVRAGLEIIDAVSLLHPLPNVGLKLRVGIATGVVVVGDVIGKGPSRQEAVVGSTSNFAARLQSLARPGDVIISSATRKLIGRSFQCVDLGPQRLKGFNEPVGACRVLYERAIEDRLESRYAESELCPLVDREVEFPALLESWRVARSGKGQVVTLRGEPGLGKSRLVKALRDAIRVQEQIVLPYYCSMRFQNTALYPVIQHLQHAARLADEDAANVKLDKLEALLLNGAPARTVASQLPYIASLLSIPIGSGYPPIADSPERQREQTLRALEAQLLNLARDQPVLMIFEDLHWVDPSTLGLIDRLVRKIGEAPVMVLVTGRPEFTPPWVTLPHALTVELSLLERDDRSSIVKYYAGGKMLPPEILEHILQKSDGIPLFVEELTKAMMDFGLLEEQVDRYVLTGPMGAFAVPSTLRDSLLARLDRLSLVKEVAQVAATIGREFSYEMLSALLPMASTELRATLNRLAEAGLVQSRGTPPDAVYTFKHALIQDAAYSTLLRARRQSLHARIAQILEADSAAANREPELLAHHLTEAGLPAKAIPYLQKAGLLASARAAHTEACKHFAEGLRLVSELSDDTTRNRLELGLRVHLGMSLAATQGFAAPEVEATNQRARELCRVIGGTNELFWVLRGLCSLYIVRADGEASLELAELCVRLGEETQRADFLIEGYLMLGYTLVYAGQLESGREALAKALEIYRTRDGARIDFPTPQDPAVASLSLLTTVSWMLGQPERATEYAFDAVQTAELTKRPFDAAYAHCFVALFETLQRNPQRAAHHAGITIEISERHGFAVWLAAGTMQMGVAKAALGQAEEAIGLLGATLPAWRAAGAELDSGFFLAGLAEAHRAAGNLNEALETISKAIEHADNYAEHYFDAERYRLRGELIAMRDGTAAQAEADFQRAIEIAQRQGAKMFELRAAVSIALAIAPAGERDRARGLLRSAIAKIESGRDTADYKKAVTLLNELSV
jgi:predicted ATPase/class 3 adenylate cyclase